MLEVRNVWPHQRKDIAGETLTNAFPLDRCAEQGHLIWTRTDCCLLSRQKAYFFFFIAAVTNGFSEA